MKELINEEALLRNVLSNSTLWDDFNYPVVKFIIDQLNAGLFSITPINSYSSHVYLLCFNKDISKFIIKIRAIDALMKLGIEVVAFKTLSKSITVPELVLYGTSSGYEIAVYRHLGSSANSRNDLLDEGIINSIWKLILTIQNTLLASASSFNLHIENSQRYAAEIHRYTLKYVGIDIPIDTLKVLNGTLCTPKFSNSITVFSDRGPVNWVINKYGIIPIDFDLLLLEPCLADFIQFIDHHELCTPYDRDTLITKCLSFLEENNILFTEEDFHWHALYRNLTQGAVFYRVSREISLYHYEKALRSSNALNEVLLEKQIKKILNEVAWI